MNGAEWSCLSDLNNPYSVIYGIRGDTLWVVAVAHHSRREGYWRGRV